MNDILALVRERCIFILGEGGVSYVSGADSPHNEPPHIAAAWALIADIDAGNPGLGTLFASAHVLADECVLMDEDAPTAHEIECLKLFTLIADEIKARQFRRAVQ